MNQSNRLLMNKYTIFPTPDIIEELRAWAFDEDAQSPTQDFDLTVSDICFSDIIIKLSADSACPKQLFFLECAYFIVGDAVLNDNNTVSKQDIRKFLEQAENTGNSHLLKFVEESKALIKNPSNFDYSQWCSGDLARKHFNYL